MIQKNDNVLDIGVGEGRYFNLIKNTLNAKSYIGVDIEPKNSKSFVIHKGFSDNLPFEDESFDSILLLSTFYNLADRKESTLQEIKRDWIPT